MPTTQEIDKQASLLIRSGFPVARARAEAQRQLERESAPSTVARPAPAPTPAPSSPIVIDTGRLAQAAREQLGLSPGAAIDAVAGAARINAQRQREADARLERERAEATRRYAGVIARRDGVGIAEAQRRAARAVRG